MGKCCSSPFDDTFFAFLKILLAFYFDKKYPPMRRTFCSENERHLTCLICGDVTEHLPVPDYYYFHVWSLYSASCCNVAPCARDDKIDDLFAAPPLPRQNCCVTALMNYPVMMYTAMRSRHSCLSPSCPRPISAFIISYFFVSCDYCLPPCPRPVTLPSSVIQKASFFLFFFSRSSS